MKIGIDGRLIDETGVGRYIRNLVQELSSIDKQSSYVIFLRRKSYDSFRPPNSHWQKRLTDIPWHSFAEQIIMPAILAKEKLDILHIPYFNVPIFYPGKLIVTIHDLTILHFDTGKASTLPLAFYQLRRLGYSLALAVGLKRAAKIIAVSEATKQEIVDHFHINPEKIIVTHEAVDDHLSRGTSHILQRLIKEPYFLYVGNAYPHKNLEILLGAIKQLTSPVKLVLVGENDFFYRRLVNLVQERGLGKKVKFFGKANDLQLKNLYAQAMALVFPSLMEGFGLPGLEAMVAGTPVVCSDIPVFHEIYGQAALFFDPKNEADLAAKLNLIASNKATREALIAQGRKEQQRYTWRKLVRETLAAYLKA